MSAWCVLTLVLMAVPDSVFDNPEPWRPLEVDGELTVEQRPIAGGPFAEYRITLTSEVPAELWCSTVFEWGTKGTDTPGVSLSRLLEDGADQRVVYTQLTQPMIALRDYAMTMRKQPLEGGACRVRFKVTNEAAPRRPDGFVRMERVWGGWLFEPQPGEKTRVTHFLYADPGGDVPAFLVHGGQKKSAKQSVLFAQAKAKAAHRAQRAPK